MADLHDQTNKFKSNFKSRKYLRNSRDESQLAAELGKWPFAVRIEREDAAWLVICRSYGWLHGSKREAFANAVEIARGFGVAVMGSR